MKRQFKHITILVDNYDNASQFYVDKLGFVKLMDNPMGPDMRWVSVAPSKDCGTKIVFVKADTPDKEARLGSQVADHVLIVLETDNWMRDYEALKEKGVKFFGEPKQMP